MNLKDISKLAVVLSALAIGGFSLLALHQWKQSRRQQLKVRRWNSRFIRIISSSQEWEELYSALIRHCEAVKVVGFDCEWVSWGHPQRRPVALIQIATQDGLCLLVRTCKICDIPRSLADFLCDRSILKVGVGVKEDGRKLRKDYGLAVNGCVELSNIIPRVRGLHKLISNFGLQGIAGSVLGVRLNKDVNIRCGDWEAEELGPEQVEYAASDALVAVDILTRLVLLKMSGKMVTTPSQTPNINVSETDFWKSTRSLCQGIVDVPFRAKQKASSKPSSGPSLQGDGSADSEQDKSDKAHRSYTVRQRPLYYNCCLLAPDGQVLCTCDVRKAEWYVQKGLADKVRDDPVAVQLRFEPAGRPTSSEDYYVQDKQNKCVVCGAEESYIRKLIVPKEYRKRFPHCLKDHSSHDVLLLCVSCHHTSTQHDSVLRQMIADEYDAPIDSGDSLNQKSLQDHDLQKVKSAAKALLNSRAKIPVKRVEELESTVKDFYGINYISDDCLQMAMSIDPRVANDNYVSHGKIVTDYLREHDQYLEFEKRWRQHFLDMMQPKYMPALWSVDHKPERLPRMIPTDV